MKCCACYPKCEDKCIIHKIEKAEEKQEELINQLNPNMERCTKCGQWFDRLNWKTRKGLIICIDCWLRDSNEN